MEYTAENINTLISSINNNTNTIRDMLSQIKNNYTCLNYKLAECASEQITLSNDQIKAYQSYIAEYKKIREAIDESQEIAAIYAPINLLSDITSVILFCTRLLNVHHKQVEVIDRLCTLLQQSNDVIKMIA